MDSQQIRLIMSSYYDPIARNSIPPSVFDNMEFSLTDGTFIKFGRPIRGAEEDKSDSLAWFKSKVVSRNHAECWMKNGVVYVKDSGSSSGTFLNGMRLSPGGKLIKQF
jgi:pSer/pThr/pTyr-binding forkhead associated (FHA) protein